MLSQLYFEKAGLCPVGHRFYRLSLEYAATSGMRARELLTHANARERAAVVFNIGLYSRRMIRNAVIVAICFLFGDIALQLSWHGSVSVPRSLLLVGIQLAIVVAGAVVDKKRPYTLGGIPAFMQTLAWGVFELIAIL